MKSDCSHALQYKSDLVYRTKTFVTWYLFILYFPQWAFANVYRLILIWSEGDFNQSNPTGVHFFLNVPFSKFVCMWMFIRATVTCSFLLLKHWEIFGIMECFLSEKCLPLPENSWYPSLLIQKRSSLTAPKTYQQRCILMWDGKGVAFCLC